MICIVTQAVKAQNYYEKFQQMVIDYIEETPALKEFNVMMQPEVRFIGFADTEVRE